MKSIYSHKFFRGALVVFCFLLFGVLESCGGSPHWGTSAGVDMTWGPNGPRVRPNVSVGVYNGGHW